MKAALHLTTVARIRTISVALATIVVLATLMPGVPARAQQPGDEATSPWSTPVNLSRSGSASAPAIAAAPGAGGVVQAFWWDRFDRLTTAIYDPASETWQGAFAAPLVVTSVVGEGENAQTVTEPIGAMPRLVADTTGRVHAFWPGAAVKETGLQPLLLGRLRLGTTGWTAPGDVAEAASAWVLDSTPNGTLHLAYVRPIESERFPAGIYYKRSTDNGATWSALRVLVASRYFRLHTAEQLNLTLHAGDESGVFIAWDDPRLGSAYLLTSGDGGETWSGPTLAGDTTGAAQPRFLQLDGAPALLWRATGAFSGCELYQQPLLPDAPAAPVRVLPDLTTCPTGLRSLETAPGTEGALLIAGEGTDTLTLFAWEGGAYSRPTPLSFSFDDPETGARVYLSDLHATLSSAGHLFVVGTAGAGTDGGEIWALHTAVTALDLAFAPPSPWSDPVAVATPADAAVSPGVPVTALDTTGRLHLLWAEGSALRYSRRDVDGRFSQPVTVAGTNGSVAPATGTVATPALLAQGDRLHAVWAQGAGSGGLGEVVYSSAYTRDAYAAGTWTSPQPLSLPHTAAAAPALIVDDSGTFHVLYAVPLNEGRGIYYTRSQDLGTTWSGPVTVFDATQPPAGTGPWPMVDHTALTADAAGTLHALFVQGSADGPFPPRSLWHTRSTDGGETWAPPLLMAEAATAHPRIAAAGAQILVLWQDLARGTLSLRTSDDYGVTWSYQQAVPGFQPGFLSGPGSGPGSIALLYGGPGALTLVGLSGDTSGGTGVQVTAWDGARWSQVDTLRLSAAPLPGAAAGLNPDDGVLHVLTWAQARTDADAVTLAHTARTLETTSSGAAPAAPVPGQPTPTPTPMPTATPEPTPRPTVNAAAPGRGTRMISAGPLSLPVSAVGGIISVAVLVLGAVLVIGRRR